MALMTSDMQEKLTTLLVDEGLITRQRLDDATKLARESGRPLLTVLTDE